MRYTLKDPTVDAFRFQDAYMNILINRLESTGCEWVLRESPSSNKACVLVIDEAEFPIVWDDYIVFDGHCLPKVMSKGEFEAKYKLLEDE